MSIWDELDAEVEAKIAAHRAEEEAKTPEQRAAERAAAVARLEAFHRQGVESGAWDEDGNEIAQPDEGEEDEEEEDEEDEE